MVAAIAFESVIKLLTFLFIGIVITYGLFNGFGDLFTQAAASESMRNFFTLNSETGYSDWFFLSLVSSFAIFLLPRQFQVAVIENVDEKHLQKAMWIFPLYLLLINIFVVPIAINFYCFSWLTSCFNSLIPSINKAINFSYLTALYPSFLKVTNSGCIFSIS